MTPDVNAPSLNELGNRPFAGGVALFLNMKILLNRLGEKYECLFDDADYDIIKNYHWCLSNQGYVYSSFPMSHKKHFLMHRLILGILNKPHLLCDHINHNRLDNRRENLRICDFFGNARNTSAYGRSKYLGVCVYNDNKYGNKYIKAGIRLNGKRVHLGYFKNEEDAAMAYDEAAKIHFGEFANLNFPL